MMDWIDDNFQMQVIKALMTGDAILNPILTKKGELDGDVKVRKYRFLYFSKKMLKYRKSHLNLRKTNIFLLLLYLIIIIILL